MYRERVRIKVPHVLGDSPHSSEGLYRSFSPMPSRPIELDLSNVRWVCPYGAIVLATLCQILSEATSEPVLLSGLRTAVHAYLQRLHFFDITADTAQVAEELPSYAAYDSAPTSLNILELTPIEAYSDIYNVVSRVRSILEHWLGPSSTDLDRIVSLISESCSNVVDHSGTRGLITIQKYEHGSHVDVHLAIGDVGQGIAQTLADAHGPVASSDTEYIRRALAGMSSRSGPRGGHGLRTIQSIVVPNGGGLYIRSGTGLVEATSAGLKTYADLTAIDGTQLAITFRRTF